MLCKEVQFFSLALQLGLAQTKIIILLRIAVNSGKSHQYLSLLSNLATLNKYKILPMVFVQLLCVDYKLQLFFLVGMNMRGDIFGLFGYIVSFFFYFMGLIGKMMSFIGNFLLFIR